MAFYEIFDNIQVTGASASTIVLLDAQTISADTIYLGSMDIKDLSANTMYVRTSSGFTIYGYLDNVIKESIEVDTTDGYLHLKGDSDAPGGNYAYATDEFGNKGWFAISYSGVTAGEANTASNVGSQIELYKDKIGVDLRFRTLSAGTGVSITQETSAVTISSAVNAPGGADTNIQYNNAGAFGGIADFVYLGGNIGIGTTLPSAKLDVQGSFLTTGSTTFTVLTADTTHPSGYRGVFVDPSTGTIYANEPSTGDTYVSSANTQGIVPGLNLYTGGTAQSPIVGLNADVTLTTLTADILSANTFYLSGTDINTVIKNEYMGAFTGSSLQYISGSSYVDVVGSGVTVTVSLGSAISANTISATTFYSGSTDLSNIFVTTTSLTGVTSIGNGVNTYVDGTTTTPIVNVSGGSFDNIYVSGITSVDSISATTFYSGSTDLSLLIGIGTIGGTGNPTEVAFWGDATTLSGYSTVTVTPYAGDITKKQLNANHIYATTTISATTFYSGSTDLSDLFSPIGSVGGGLTTISNGLNTYTGGTTSIPTVNISGASIYNLSASGSVTFAGLSSSASTVVLASTVGVLSTAATEDISGMSIAFGNLSGTSVNILGSGATNCLIMEDQATGIEYNIYLSGGSFVFIAT